MIQNPVSFFVRSALLQKPYCGYLWVLWGMLVGISACSEKEGSGKMDAVKLIVPAPKVDSHYQVMIETPAGEIDVITFIPHTGVMDTLSGGRSDYLPHPVNAGFIPQMEDGNLRKIPVWILGRRLQPADSLAVYIVGLLEYQVKKEFRREWLAIPADTLKQTINIQTFRELIMEYDPVKFMLEYWIKNRYNLGEVTNLTWSDEKKALALLEDFF